MAMFESILGQASAIATLGRALSSGRIHHGYRFEGPSGVGKETAAFAFAQALVCTTPPPAGEAFVACGRCSACRRAVTFAAEPPRVPLHPDVILIERGLYSPESLRRRTPEAQEISVDQIRRLVLEHMSFAPHEGRSRIFIVRRAHEMSVSAANALLKTLEEPAASTYFVLLTDRGNELVPTVQSRTHVVRFAPLPESIVASILEKDGIDPVSARTAAELSGGSVEQARLLADPAALEELTAFVEAALAAVRAPDLGTAIAFAESRERDKDVLLSRLAGLAARFAREGRKLVAAEPGAADVAARRYGIVARAMHDLERNGAPALVLESMIARLRAPSPSWTTSRMP
jgi:DNA polymerase-3 subunit delta'